MTGEDWNPGKLLQTSGGYWPACVLHASVKLGVFTILADRDLGSREVALALDADERGVSMLLDALAAMGLLSKEGGRYRNTAASRSFLVQDSPQYVGHMIMHHHHLVESWSRLDQAVRTGSPVRTRASLDDAKVRESFLMGMFNNAMSIAPQVAGQVDLAGRRRLLDLGGGPGTYAIHFCLRNPGLKTTVYDLPTTRPFAEKVIARFGLSDRVRFAAGDYLRDPVEGRYDVAWLSHILHAEGPEDCQTIVRKAVAALEPGGLVLVHEFILDDARASPLFPALFSLNMLLGTERGQSYTESEIKDMLANAGVTDIRRLPFRAPADSGIISGVV
jgi:SAM-dependent methyltransferase